MKTRTMAHSRGPTVVCQDEDGIEAPLQYLPERLKSVQRETSLGDCMRNAAASARMGSECLFL